MVLERFHLDSRGELLVKGRSVGEKIGQGPARVIRSSADLEQLQPGEVLVTEMTDPDWEPVMKRAAAVVTDRGGRTCHAAIVSRELGIPAIVGTGTGTSSIRTGEDVTVSCAEGDEGFVYRGRLPIRVERTNLADLPRPRTHMMMNVANPAEAFSLSFLPNDGVGLARLEFIIGTHVRAHPMALLRPGQISDPKQRREIERLTAGYTDKGQYFVDRLAEGVAMIAAAFWPKDVIVRLSDFKTNEYAGLLGGAAFEPREENPMLGFRGASRYYDERYREGFGLECRAMRKVREVMGLQNVKLMVPFCRTVEEGRRVIAEMATHGLVQGERGLEIYVMCEIPSNVTLAAEFAKVFDGFSIGSNDLTQLILGVDRDSELVAHLFDERNDAVTQTIAQVIRAAHAAGRKIGICGQAPSDYPEFAQFLVAQGIDSISLNPDSVLKTMLAIVEAEATRQERRRLALARAAACDPNVRARSLAGVSANRLAIRLRLGHLGHRGDRAQEGETGTGDNALRHRGAGGVNRVVERFVAALHLGFRGGADADDRDAARQLGEALFELLAVVVRRGVGKLFAQLLTPSGDCRLVAPTTDDGRMLTIDDDSRRPAEMLGRHVFELDAEFWRDELSAGHDRHVLQHGFPTVAKARRSHGDVGDHAAQAIHDQGWPGPRLRRPRR